MIITIAVDNKPFEFNTERDITEQVERLDADQIDAIESGIAALATKLTVARLDVYRRHYGKVIKQMSVRVQ